MSQTTPPARGTRALVVGGLLLTALFIPFTLVTGSPTSDGSGLVRSGRLWGLLLGIVPNLLLGIGLWRLRARLAGTLLLPWVASTTAALALWGSAVIDLLFQGLGPPLGLLVLAPAVLAVAATAQPREADERRARLLFGLLGAVLAAAVVLVFVPAGESTAAYGYRVFGLLAYAVPGLLWAAIGLVLRAPPAERARPSTA